MNALLSARTCGMYACSVDDDRARHLEDEAGGIGGGDVSSFFPLILTAGIYIYIQTQEQMKGQRDGKRTGRGGAC
jgi:hypothetical protein